MRNKAEGVYAVLFRGLERLGVHLTPRHYHFPIPDLSSLPEEIWTKETDLPGLNLDPSPQVDLLEKLVPRYRPEFAVWPRKGAGKEFHLENGHFETVDAEVYHCLLRNQPPRRILEIGAGYSTLLAAQALGMNAAEGRPGGISIIDPRPPSWARPGERHIERVIPRPVQEVPFSEFTSLERGDILFIDSSHVLTIGSDVQFLFLEAVPRLVPGVRVHVHDVFLPAEYPRYWVRERLRFWNEQYLLQAFLAFNSAFRVLWASHFMALRHPDRLRDAIPSFSADKSPGSFWMERVS